MYTYVCRHTHYIYIRTYGHVPGHKSQVCTSCFHRNPYIDPISPETGSYSPSPTRWSNFGVWAQGRYITVACVFIGCCWQPNGDVINLSGRKPHIYRASPRGATRHIERCTHSQATILLGIMGKCIQKVMPILVES